MSRKSEFESKYENMHKVTTGKSEEAGKGYGTPRVRWDARCGHCGGRGMALNLAGVMDECPRCEGTGER